MKTEVITKNDVLKPQLNTLTKISASAKINIATHIKNTLISEEIKQIILLDLDAEKNTFYFCYASLFTNEQNDFIDKVNIAGYLYYKYLLATDELVDNTASKNTFKNLILSNFYQEESIRLLTILFNPYPKFWEYWATRKNEYLNAFQTDKKFLTSLSDIQFQTLADNKSANGKVAIDSLLIKDLITENEYNKLLHSHKLFSCGFQYYDDVLDLNQDIINKQTNIALCNLKQEMRDEDFLKELENPDKLHKLMHIKGIASLLLKKSITCFDEARNIVADLNCPYWKDVINLKKKEVCGILQNVDFYLESIKIKTRLSTTKIKYNNGFDINIESVIKNGINFIATEQENDGSWKDSPVNTWLSGYWTTGYVLNALANCEKKLTESINIKKALNYLNQKTTSVWPYIEGWVEDADSTNFALLGAISNSQDVTKELQELLTYQKKDGGFTTYKDPSILLEYLDDPKINNVSGWVQSHTCVSAGTLLVLSKMKGYDKEINKLIDYLLSSISKNKLWNSYWWTSEIYSTAFIIEASVTINNENLNNAVQYAIPALMNLQQTSGLFADEFNKEHIFYSALVLNALCSSDLFFVQYEKQLNQLVKAILNTQNEDGSWDSSYALRVPAADCLNPKKIDQWRKHDLGQNVIIEDIHRTITTSTVLAALSRYEKRTGSRRNK